MKWCMPPLGWRGDKGKPVRLYCRIIGGCRYYDAAIGPTHYGAITWHHGTQRGRWASGLASTTDENVCIRQVSLKLRCDQHPNHHCWDYQVPQGLEYHTDGGGALRSDHSLWTMAMHPVHECLGGTQIAFYPDWVPSRGAGRTLWKRWLQLAVVHQTTLA